MSERIILFGGGGHAKVVLEALRSSRPSSEVAVLDDLQEPSQSLLGERIAGGRDWLSNNWPGAPVVPAIGSNAARAQLVEWLRSAGRRLETAVAASAVVSRTACLGGGSFLAPGAIVNAEVTLAEGVIVNTGASVDHDCSIGFCAHVAPGARLCGGVTVGARSLVGAGAVVIPSTKIGTDVVIGAGSVVLGDLPDGARVAGCPAKAI